MPIEGYHLGCGVWNNPDWSGSLFSQYTRPSRYLSEYSSVFNAVEGNSTFYGVPSIASIDRWLSDTFSGFKFCFKFPRLISHERRLTDTGRHTQAFLDLLMQLGDRVGPVFLQLPPSFGPDELPQLDHFLADLPGGLRYAVEVRHPDFYSFPGADLNAILSQHGSDRVVLDNRSLILPGNRYRVRDGFDSLVEIGSLSTGQCPFVRFVGGPDVSMNLPLLSDWSRLAAHWIKDGKTPYFFIHTSDDKASPHLARIFHELLSSQVMVGKMPDWPGEIGEKQLSLF